MRKTLTLTLVALLALAAAGAASSSSEAAVRFALPQPANDGPFTVQLPVAHAAMSPLKGDAEGYAATVHIGRSIVRIDKPSWKEFTGDGALDENQTPLAAAEWLVKHVKGLHLNTADHNRRVELFAGHDQLKFLTFQAEAVEMRTFRIQLVRDGGDGQKVMRELDSNSTRFWLGHTDPRTIKNAPDGVALLKQVDAAANAQKQMTLTITPWVFYPSLKVETDTSGYQAMLDDKGDLVGWADGSESLDWDSGSNCWNETVGSEAPYSSFETDGYALTVGKPTQDGRQITVPLTSWSTNVADRPDTIALTVDGDTHLPVQAVDAPGNLTDSNGKPVSLTEVFDWTTPVVEQPKPTRPICKS